MCSSLRLAAALQICRAISSVLEARVWAESRLHNIENRTKADPEGFAFRPGKQLKQAYSMGGESA